MLGRRLPHSVSGKAEGTPQKCFCFYPLNCLDLSTAMAAVSGELCFPCPLQPAGQCSDSLSFPTQFPLGCDKNVWTLVYNMPLCHQGQLISTRILICVLLISCYLTTIPGGWLAGGIETKTNSVQIQLNLPVGTEMATSTATNISEYNKQILIW